MRMRGRARGIGGGAAKSMIGPTFIFLVFIVPLFHAVRARAFEEKAQADELIYQEGAFTFKGHAQIQRDGTTLKADRATYYEKTSELYIEGNIHYESGDVIMQGDEGLFNLENETGFLYNGSVFFKKENYHIKGQTIEKLGETDYQVWHSTLTTCQGDCPDWSFNSRVMKTNARTGLSAFGMTFRVKDLPVFYTPYFTAPVQVARKSGLLLPEYGYRQFTGFYLKLPYYWAISSNRDLTAGLDVYMNRGLGGETEYRYMETNGMSGDQRITVLRDWKADRDYLAARGAHFYYGDAGDAFLAVDMLNHRDFYQLYNLNLQDSESRYLETRGEAWIEPFAGVKTYLLTRLFQDLEPGVDQKTILQKLPEAGVFVEPRELGPMTFTLQSDAANFWREEGQTGERFRLEPTLAHSFGDGLSFFQSFGAGSRTYSLQDPSENMERMAFLYQNSLTARLDKNYGSFTHYLEPSLSFYHENLSGNQPALIMDSTELEQNTNTVELSVMNRFFNTGGEFLLFNVDEQYDFDAPRRLQPVTLNVSSAKPFALRAQLAVDPYSTRITTADVEGGLEVMKDTLIHFRERYSKDEATWTHIFGASFKIMSNLLFDSNVWLDSKGGGLRELRTTFNYISKCWNVVLTVAKRPNDFAVSFQIGLAGIVKTK